MTDRRLREFVVAAHRNGYATGDLRPDGTGGKVADYRDGDFRYVDRYHGSRSFVGRETVFRNDVPVWGMHYHGAPTDETVDHERVYAFLRDALAAVSADAPYRGPKTFEGDDFAYRTEFEGTLSRFSGTETIETDDSAVYRGRYAGCLIE